MMQLVTGGLYSRSCFSEFHFDLYWPNKIPTLPEAQKM